MVGSSQLENRCLFGFDISVEIVSKILKAPTVVVRSQCLNLSRKTDLTIDSVNTAVPDIRQTRTMGQVSRLHFFLEAISAARSLQCSTSRHPIPHPSKFHFLAFSTVSGHQEPNVGDCVFDTTHVHVKTNRFAKTADRQLIPTPVVASPITHQGSTVRARLKAAFHKNRRPDRSK